MVLLSTVLATLLSFSTAKPTGGDFVVRNSREAAPPGFGLVGPPAQSQSLSFRIGVASRNISGLESTLYAVSTPSSPQYGQHLTLEELNTFLSPTEETTTVVKNWLSSHGLSIESTSSSGDWISLAMTVAQANKVLNANYQVFKHLATGKQITRTLSYSLPSSLAGHVDVVHPTTSFDVLLNQGPIISTPRTNISINGRAADPSCGTDFTPECVLAEYNIPSTPATQASNALGVTGYVDEFAQFSDLEVFLEVLRPDVDPTTGFSVVSIDGGINPQGANEAGTEANLDIQYTVGIATGVPVTFFTVGGVVTIEQFANAIIDVGNFLIADATRPQVLTTSYGTDEDLVEPDLFVKLCNGYMALGALGVSILFASGDGGVAGGHGESSCTAFPPSWPVGCPFITSVGATTGIPETSATFSSGGFSNVFAQPSFQTTAVSDYLTELGNSDILGRFNASGRAYPDVAAIGDFVEIVVGDEGFLVGGTSCSSPIFASVIALINDRLIAAGKPQLGFLNPFLYANPSAFNDITTGSNPGCGTDGFPALSGWDPVTGLGTPHFPALLAAAGL